MQKLIASLLIPLLWAGTAAASGNAECVSVTRTEWEPRQTELGTTTVEWSAELSNECEGSYNATLAVLFTDGEGEVLHRTVAIVIVPHEGTRTAEKTEYIPANRFPEVEAVEVEITERRRPH